MGVVIGDDDPVDTGIDIGLDPLSEGGLVPIAVMALSTPVVLRGRRVRMDVEPPPTRTRG
jgi:hypothetical protein